MSNLTKTDGKLSAYGVCYDLEHSPYESYSCGFVFKFSTKQHLDKFNRELWKRQEWVKDSLSHRFKIEVDLPELAVFQLYDQTESRGCCVIAGTDSGKYEVITCLNSLSMRGQIYVNESC